MREITIPPFKPPVEAWAAELKRTIESYLEQVKPIQFTTTAELRPPTMDWLVMGLSDTGQMLYSHGGVWHALGTGGGEVEDGDKGDITVSAGGTIWTIDPDTVTNSKLVNMPAGTIKGNNTGVAGDPQDLTAAQVAAMLPVFTSGAKGLVPPPGAPSGKVLQDDGTWITPADGGAPVDAAYFVVANDPTLTNERTLIFGIGLQTIDGGADGNFLVNWNAWDIGDTKSLLEDIDILPIGDSGATTAAKIITFADFKASLAVFTDTVQGVVPASGGGTANFLRADGTFAVPPGIGGVSDGDKGDITVSSGGTVWTIDDGVVSNAKLADMEAGRIKGRDAGGTGDPQDLTGAQVAAFLPEFSFTTAGLVPPSVSASLKVLGDGGWTNISGGMIIENTIPNNRLQQVAALTFKGNSAGSVGNVQDMTAAEATAILDLFTTSLKGLAPASGGGTTNFLRADGTWGVPPGTGGVSDGDKGDIVISGGVWTIDNAVVSNAKLQGMVEATIKGRAAGAGTGTVTDLTAAQVRTILNVADGANAYVHPNHSGDVTSVGDGAQTIVANAVSDIKLRDSLPLSVIGRASNTGGDPADISASVDGQVLRRSGLTLGFGTVATAGIADDAVTNAKLANVATSTIKGRATASTGDPEDLTAAQVRTILNVADGANNYSHPNHTGDVTSVGDGAQTIANNAVTFAKMADIATSRLIGRQTASTGDPEALTVGGGIEFVTGGIQTSAFTGEVTKAAGGTALTIANDAVINARLANMAQNTIKGRVTASTGDPEDLTAAQVVTVIASGSGGGTANFLRADGTWAVPPGTGGGLSDGDKGDITVSSSGTVWTIDAGVVTNAKLATMAANSIKGNNTGSTAAPVDLTAAQVRTLIETGHLSGTNAWSGVNTFAVPISLSTAVGTPATFDLYAQSSAPAVGHVVGLINAVGRDAAIADITYSQIFTTIDDLTADSEASYVSINVLTGGALTPGLFLNAANNPEGATTARPGAILTRRGAGVGNSAFVKESGTGNTGWAAINTGPIPLIIAVGDETTAITTGAAKVTFRAPFAMTIEGLPRASLNTVSSSGNPTVDINKNGTSILGANKLSIDAGEKTSVTATTATSVSTATFADDDEITIDIDTAGTGAKGLKVAMLVRKTG